jgi:hypothetical protein
LLAVFLTCLCSWPAYALDANCTKTSTSIHPQKRDGGVWLNQHDANIVLFELETCLPDWKRDSAAKNSLIAVQAKTIRTASSAVSLSGDALTDQTKRAEYWRQDALANQSIWRSPVLWFGIGVVTAGGIAIGMAYGLKGARQ